jgi:uncharacterized membrane protein
MPSWPWEVSQLCVLSYLLNNGVMKILGHPLHLMLIHFPSALFPMDFVCAILCIYTGNAAYGDASFFALMGGVIVGWVAVITGALDLLRVMRENTGAMNSALIHGGINTTVLLGYTLFAYYYYLHPEQVHSISTANLVTKGALVFILMAGNYIGGNLILKHKVAVEK